MNNNIYLQPFFGFCLGTDYALSKQSEIEIKQGKNYYLSALGVISQLGLLGNVVQTINKMSIKLRPIGVMCGIFPLLYAPIAILSAAVKHGEYEKLSNYLRNTCKIPFPKKLGKRSVAFFTFLANHLGNVMRVAMVVGSVAIIALGNPGFGIGLIIPLGFQAMEEVGFLSHKIRLFVDKYLRDVILIGMTMSGNLLVKAISIVHLCTRLTKFIPTADQKVLQKADQVFRSIFTLPGPSLKEFNAPLVKKTNFNYEEINQLLDLSDSEFQNQYEMNVAHLNKWAVDLEKVSHLPKDSKFDKFSELFEKTDWKKKYTLIRNKFKDDDRFLDFLSDKFPEFKKLEDPKSNTKMDKYIEDLAVKKGLTKEAYLAEYLQSQMKTLITVLNKKGNVKGSAKELEEAIHDCRWILPHLSALDLSKNKNKIELEDTLLQLAVEGGDYCAKGVKRAANEILSGILQTSGSDDPIINYEYRVLQSLQNLRKGMISSMMNNIAKYSTIANKFKSDVHAFEAALPILSFGFVPQTKGEQEKFGLMFLGSWEHLHPLRKELCDVYQKEIPNVFKQVGDVHFGNYIPAVINANEQLNDQQKDNLIDKFIGVDKWDTEEAVSRFRRLFLVRSGIFIPKKKPKG